MPILSKADKDEFNSPVERLLASVANLVQQPNSKGSHFFRTSLRRFQAWSDVFHPRLDAEQKNALKFLDKLRKSTGKLRDSEVHIDLLKELHAGGDKKRLAKQLKSRRNQYEKDVKARLRDPIVSSLWRTLRPLDQAPPKSNEPEIFHPVKGMTTLALDEYRAFVQRHGKISSDNLHEYRLECKRFRYTAELAGEIPEANALIEAWKAVQDVIGEWHDYLTLTEIAEKILDGSPVVTSLRGLTDKKYSESCSAVASTERKLIGQRVLKKAPRKTAVARRSRAA
jgi:CHAD domain-containing protein